MNEAQLQRQEGNRDTGVCLGWRGGSTPGSCPGPSRSHTHTLKCHKTNRTQREMHYLNFHHYFSPWLAMFLLIYFLVCFPQAVLFSCISFLSFLSRQQPAPVGGTRGCPAFFRLSRLSSHGKAGGMRQQSSIRVGKMWSGQQVIYRQNILLFPSTPDQARTRGQYRTRIPSHCHPSQGLAWD